LPGWFRLVFIAAMPVVLMSPLPAVAEGNVEAMNPPGIADQVRQNWNVGSVANSPECMRETVTLRVSLLPDGTITHVEPVHAKTDGSCFDRLADSAKRAFLITRRLQLPPGKTYQAITFIFQPGELQ